MLRPTTLICLQLSSNISRDLKSQSDGNYIEYFPIKLVPSGLGDSRLPYYATYEIHGFSVAMGLTHHITYPPNLYLLRRALAPQLHVAMRVAPEAA